MGSGQWAVGRAKPQAANLQISNLNIIKSLMHPFTTHTGLVVPLDRSDVNTDDIIPKQFLKRIERTGFGEFLFFDWRFATTARQIRSSS